MKAKHVRVILAVIFLGLLSANNALATLTMVIYIYSGQSNVDSDSFAELEIMVDELNEGGVASNNQYQLVHFYTFEEAQEYALRDRPYLGNLRPAGSGIVTCCHGSFNPATQKYNGTLRDTKPNNTDETVVKGMLGFVLHCKQNNSLDRNDMGRAIAKRNEHRYGINYYPTKPTLDASFYTHFWYEFLGGVRFITWY